MRSCTMSASATCKACSSLWPPLSACNSPASRAHAISYYGWDSLLVCAVVTFSGDWIYLQHSSAAIAWFDVGWALPLVAAGLIAFTWMPFPEPHFDPDSVNFLSFLGTNLVLVAMLSCVALLMDRWKQAYGEILTSVAIAASLLAFALRLALTQFHQQKEIAERKAAQLQLTAAHRKVGFLLDEARRQTAEITQISEIGSLLQACTSRGEVFRLIPERLRCLFPGASGCHITAEHFQEPRRVGRPMGNRSPRSDLRAWRLLGSPPRMHARSSWWAFRAALLPSAGRRPLRLHSSYRQWRHLRNAIHPE